MPRPDEQEPVVFDLVEGDGPDAEAGGSESWSVSAGAAAGGRAGAAAGDPAGPPVRRLPRLPRLSRRTWLVAASVVTVLAVTVVAVDLVRDHRRAELMRTSPLGVASLDDPPAETWTVPFDVPAEGLGTFVDQQLVIMDGLLVLPPASAQSYTVDPSTGATEPIGFADVTAVDPGSGEVVWRVAVDERPVCGPAGYDASTSTDVLVCVHGPDDAREVLTIAPDGGTRSRPADLADGEQIFPGPDGLAVRVERVGPPDESAECDASGPCVSSVLTGGRDVLVTAEDAETGAERWTSTVEFAPVDVVNCQQYDPVTGEEAGVDLDQVTVYTGARMIDVDGCGARATLSAQGVRLDLVGRSDGTIAWVTELGGGRFAVHGSGADTTVVDEAGETLHELDGWVQTGMQSPDAPDDLWFVGSPSGDSGVDAMREDGSVAWTDRYSQQVLLAGRDVVVMDRGNRVVGLDRTTGDQLWEWSSEETLGLSRYRTLTDGETAALTHLSQASPGEGLIVALDLSSGEQLWDVPTAGSVVAVDGHLVEVSPEGLTGRG